MAARHVAKNINRASNSSGIEISRSAGEKRESGEETINKHRIKSSSRRAINGAGVTLASAIEIAGVSIGMAPWHGIVSSWQRCGSSTYGERHL